MKFRKTLQIGALTAIIPIGYNLALAINAYEVKSNEPIKDLAHTRNTRGMSLTGTARVIDADTIKVDTNFGLINVRLHGIDAAEIDQLAIEHGQITEHGKQIRDIVKKWVEGKEVNVDIKDVDLYGRAIGTVECEGVDLGEWLVKNGYAIAAYSYDYLEAEREARTSETGLWGFDEAYEPRSWRRNEHVSVLDRPTPTDHALER